MKKDADKSFALGIVLGAGAALLLSSKAMHKRTKQMLSKSNEKTSKAADVAKEKAAEAKKSINSTRLKGDSRPAVKGTKT